MSARWGPPVPRARQGRAVRRLVLLGVPEPTPRLEQPIVRRVLRRLERQPWQHGRALWDRDAGGRDYTVDCVHVEYGLAPDPIWAGLDMGPVWVRSRRYLLQGVPVMWAVSYYPAHIVDGTQITRPDSGPGGVYARLSELGYPPLRFVENIQTRMPTRREARVLGLPRNVPVMSTVRTTWAADGTPIEIAVQILAGDCFLLRVTIDAEPAPVASVALASAPSLGHSGLIPSPHR
ncbi:UTRA domain-containing protein [Streptosporangiaceae bacterium NEAU-GS5]|nr:UTRA domain-containing protein [Streptosporangiaceae bacterium NEAU-GS5]